MQAVKIEIVLNDDGQLFLKVDRSSHVNQNAQGALVLGALEQAKHLYLVENMTVQRHANT